MNLCILRFFPLLIMLAACVNNHEAGDSGAVRKVSLEAPDNKSVAAFASGCFWCTEHIFEAIPGVDSAISGYAGGNVPDPTYELVNTETTGHAETVLVYFDPNLVTYEELVRVFFLSHDPTTPDRQGPDVGSSYRSILFYSTEAEHSVAKNVLEEFKSAYQDPIVTEVKPLEAFYRAEGYHQNYIEHNPSTPYVQRVSIPRFEKFKKAYKGKLKPGY